MEDIKVWKLHVGEVLNLRTAAIVAVPSVPLMKGEHKDRETDRIIVHSSLYDCFRRLDMFEMVNHYFPDRYKGFTRGEETIVIPTYMAEVRPEVLVRPTTQQVSNVWRTHEMWITRPYGFSPEGACFVRVMYNIPGTEFSRIGVIFKKTKEINRENILDSVDWSDLPDMHPGPIVYGTEFEFAYLANNPARRHISEELYAKDPEAYYKKEE